MSFLVMRNLLLLITMVGAVASDFPDIVVPSTVAAGTDMRITTNTTMLESDTEFDKYSLFLSIDPPNKTMPHPSFMACYFYKALALNLTDLITSMPASAGPSGSYYTVTALAYSGDPNSHQNAYGCNFPDLETGSESFDFTGGTSNFTQFETDVLHPPGDFWNIPCSSYDCVRKCNQAGSPDNNKDFPNNYHSTYQCIATCPGITYRSFEDYFGPCNSVSSTNAIAGSATAGSGATSAGGSAITSAAKASSVPASSPALSGSATAGGTASSAAAPPAAAPPAVSSSSSNSGSMVSGSATAGSIPTQSGGGISQSRVTTRVHTVTASSVVYTTPTAHVSKPSGTTATSLSAFRGVNRKLYLAVTSIFGFFYGGIMR
jgi:hypothetical protein